MDGKTLQQRVKALRLEMAAILDSEARFKLRRAYRPMDKAAHEARRAALEEIKVELASLLPPKSNRSASQIGPRPLKSPC